MLTTDLIHTDELMQEGRSSTGVNFVSGTIAAVAATLATQPADVIRTRMQLVAHQGVHMGPLQTLQTAFKTGGAKALLVGTVPRVSLGRCVHALAHACRALLWSHSHALQLENKADDIVGKKLSSRLCLLHATV